MSDMAFDAGDEAERADRSSRFVPSTVPAGETTSDERLLALLVHLSLLLPGPSILAPIIVYFVKKDESAFIADHAREAMNFQLSLLLYTVIIAVIGVATCGVGYFALPVVAVLGLVGMILGVIAANRGDYFRYPMTLRLVGG